MIVYASLWCMPSGTCTCPRDQTTSTGAVIFHVRLCCTGLGFQANIVEKYVLLCALLHIFVGLKRTRDQKLSSGLMSGHSISVSARHFLVVLHIETRVTCFRWRSVLSVCIAGKGNNSLQHYNLVHKFIPMPQAMKIPAAKAAVDKEWGNFEKILVWNLTKVRNKKEVIDEARNNGKSVHVSLLTDLCHLKNSEMEPRYQKYKGAVVLRSDDSGAYAVFTEQGSSASQMTTAKVMDIIFPDFQDVQVKQPMQYPFIRRSKWKVYPNYWNFQSQNAQIFGFVYHDTNGPKSWSSKEDPVVPLERNLYGHPLAGLSWEMQFEKVLLQHGWEKVSNCECFFVHRERKLFLSVYVDDIKLAGNKQNIDPDLESTQ